MSQVMQYNESERAEINEVGFQFSHKGYQENKFDCYRITSCRISVNTPQGVVYGKGAAFCSSKDNFNKEVGRKIALRRAINSTGLNKDQRRLVWMTYLSNLGSAKGFPELVVIEPETNQAKTESCS